MAPIIYNAAGVPNYDRNPGYSGDGGKAGNARLSAPTGVATDNLGNMYFADTANNRIRKVASSTTGTITTVAGNGTSGFSGDGAAATSAQVSYPTGVVVDSAGDIFIADTLNERIREVTTDGKIHTVAGNGSCPDSSHGPGDGGPATSARLCLPTSVAVDGTSVYIADTLNSEVRKFTVGGTITKLAGYGQVSFPEGVAADPLSHSVYVGDTFDNQIKKITQPGGVVSTFAGSGTKGFADGSAGSAQFNAPSGVAVNSGDVFVSDTGNDRIRKITAGTVSTYGGTGVIGYSGDGGPATQAKLDLPENLCQNQDMSNKMGGNNSGNCQIYLPTGVAGAAQAGEVFLADTNNNHVRAITPGAPPVIPETSYSLLLPLSALLLGGGGYTIIRRRRRSPAARVTV
jgi:sugar lactone lactonase YvrE